MNNVSLNGRLTKDPELRYTNAGKAVCSFILAVSRRTQANPDGADFIRCIAWEGRGETIANHFKKGNQIGISGNIKTGFYETGEGQRIYTTDVIVTDFDFLDPKGHNPNGSDNSSSSQSGGWTPGGGPASMNGNMKNEPNYPDPFENNDDSIEISDDDLPF